MIQVNTEIQEDGIQELVLEEGVNLDDEDQAVAEEASVEAQVIQDDEGQIIHDDEIVKSIRDKAIYMMRAQGIVMSYEEEQMALKIFPAVMC